MPTVTLYHTSARENELNKALTGATSRACKFIENVDTGRPVIILDYFAEYSGFNYALIDGYYYYLDPPELTTGGRVSYTMRRDVLMSYRAGILAAPCIAARTQNDFNSDLYDQRQAVESGGTNYSLFIHDFSYAHNQICLAVIGGK